MSSAWPLRSKRRKSKVVEDADVVTCVVVCDPGDEAVSALTDFARAERLQAAQITAVGAFERAAVGWFDREARGYRRIPVNQLSSMTSGAPWRPAGLPEIDVETGASASS